MTVIKKYAAFISEQAKTNKFTSVPLNEASGSYREDPGVSHNVTSHKGNPKHAVGNHLDKHHPDEDHSAYVQIHKSKDGRHTYHANVGGENHYEDGMPHAHYIHHDTHTGKVSDIPSHTRRDTGNWKSYKSAGEYAKHVEKTTGHKMDSESAKVVHHHHEVQAHGESDQSHAPLPKHITHGDHKIAGVYGGPKAKASHHAIKTDDHGNHYDPRY